jgi:enamine deaminase RidA (YjgF/YER057c/UK114 family)
MSADERFDEIAREVGLPPDGELKIGGNYVPVRRHGAELWVSGQIPRIGDRVAVVGRAGADVVLAEAQRAARICALRALALLRRTLGTLDAVEAVLRVGVFIQCTAMFTHHSEVADAASEVLHRVLGEAGAHARTSVGVQQLPKDATVELELVAAARPGA